MGKGVTDEMIEAGVKAVCSNSTRRGYYAEILRHALPAALAMRALDKPTEADAERVARALYAASGHEAERVAGPDCFAPGYDEDDEYAREFCRTLARAAIAALQDGV